MYPSTIPAAEWTELARLAADLRPVEVGNFPGVALRYVDDRRRWTIVTPWTTVEVVGGLDEQANSHTAWLPVRLIRQAAALAERDGSCSLAVGVRAVIARADSGTVRSVLPEITLPAPKLHADVTEDAPSATITAGRLRQLLADADTAPIGIDHTRGLPEIRLCVEPGELVASVDWSAFGAATVTTTVPAETSGRAVAVLPNGDLARLLGSVEPDSEIRVMVLEQSRRVRLVADRWSAESVMAKQAARSDEQGPAHVDDAMLEFGPRRRDGQSWFVDIDGTTLVVSEIDDQTVRAETRVAHSDDLGDNVYEAINEVNATLSQVRFCIRRGEIRAEVDLPRHRIADLPDALHALVEAVERERPRFERPAASPPAGPAPPSPASRETPQ